MATIPGLGKLRFVLSPVAILITSSLAMMLEVSGRAAVVGDAASPVLQFIEPANGAVFSTRDEIPIVLRAFATNDVFLTADVFADQFKIATASYCCALCPCWAPQPGDETILQIPVPWDGTRPPPRPWQGWTNVPAGTHRLTARATGDNGTMVEAAPVTITVIDRTLRIFLRADGGATLVIDQGSLVAGSYDLEASQDLRAWTRLGSFEPGNVAAFYFDVPPDNARAKKFYRAVFIPPPSFSNH
jgi:hypothetical protein